MQKPHTEPIPASPHLGDHQLGHGVGFINGEHGLCCDLLQRGEHIDASVVDEAVQPFVSHNFFHFLDHFLDAVLTDHICAEEAGGAPVSSAGSAWHETTRAKPKLRLSGDVWAARR